MNLALLALAHRLHWIKRIETFNELGNTRELGQIQAELSSKHRKAEEPTIGREVSNGRAVKSQPSMIGIMRLFLPFELLLVM